MNLFKLSLKIIGQVIFVIIFFSTLEAKSSNKFNDADNISDYFSGILLLNDNGKLGIRSVDGDIVKFNNVTILEDSESGLWITGIPKNLELIVQGQGFVEDNQKVLINKL